QTTSNSLSLSFPLPFSFPFSEVPCARRPFAGHRRSVTLPSQPSRNPAGAVTRPGIVTSHTLKSCPGNSDPGVPDVYGDNARAAMLNAAAPHRHHRAPRAVNPGQYTAYSRTGARAAPQMASQSVETTTRFQSAATTATTEATAPVAAADHRDVAPSARPDGRRPAAGVPDVPSTSRPSAMPAARVSSTTAASAVRKRTQARAATRTPPWSRARPSTSGVNTCAAGPLSRSTSPTRAAAPTPTTANAPYSRTSSPSIHRPAMRAPRGLFVEIARISTAGIASVASDMPNIWPIRLTAPTQPSPV